MLTFKKVKTHQKRYSYLALISAGGDARPYPVARLSLSRDGWRVQMSDCKRNSMPCASLSEAKELVEQRLVGALMQKFGALEVSNYERRSIGGCRWSEAS